MNGITYDLLGVGIQYCTITTKFRLTNIFCSACDYDSKNDILIPCNNPDCKIEAEEYNKQNSPNYEILICIKDNNGEVKYVKFYSDKMEKLTEEDLEKINAT